MSPRDEAMAPIAVSRHQSLAEERVCGTYWTRYSRKAALVMCDFDHPGQHSLWSCLPWQKTAHIKANCPYSTRVVTHGQAAKRNPDQPGKGIPSTNTRPSTKLVTIPHNATRVLGHKILCAPKKELNWEKAIRTGRQSIRTTAKYCASCDSNSLFPNDRNTTPVKHHKIATNSMTEKRTKYDTCNQTPTSWRLPAPYACDMSGPAARLCTNTPVDAVQRSLSETASK
mmetsp:Transcript_56689/g.172574  ORF Transcript_56689/g.172574 Transcript_56689/m.172574 type:complete len:227 (+) Transcript_56689:700-1380(+)